MGKKQGQTPCWGCSGVSPNAKDKLTNSLWWPYSTRVVETLGKPSARSKTRVLWVPLRRIQIITDEAGLCNFPLFTREARKRVQSTSHSDEKCHSDRPLARQEGQPDHRSCCDCYVSEWSRDTSRKTVALRHNQTSVHKFTFVRAGAAHHHKTFTVSRRIEGSRRQRSLPHQIKRKKVPHHLPKIKKRGTLARQGR